MSLGTRRQKLLMEVSGLLSLFIYFGLSEQKKHISHHLETKKTPNDGSCIVSYSYYLLLIITPTGPKLRCIKISGNLTSG